MVSPRITLVYLVMLLLVVCLYAGDRKPKIVGLQDAFGQIHRASNPGSDGNLLQRLNESDVLRELSAAEKVRLITKNFRSLQTTPNRSKKSEKLREAGVVSAKDSRKIRLRFDKND